MNTQTTINNKTCSCKAANTHESRMNKERSMKVELYYRYKKKFLRFSVLCILFNSNAKRKITNKNTISDRLWTVVLISQHCFILTVVIICHFVITFCIVWHFVFLVWAHVCIRICVTIATHFTMSISFSPKGAYRA